MRRLLFSILFVVACAHRDPTLAYTSERDGNTDIYLRTRQGERRLTNDPRPDEYPAISRSGAVVFVRGARGARDLWILEDGKERRLTSDEGDEATPAWSADGQLVYYTHTLARQSRIFRIREDGADARAISANNDAYPALSPDGKTIAVHSYRDGNGKTAIFLMDTNGGNQRRLTEAVARDHEPAFSPDGKSVAFSSNRGGATFQLYLIDLATGSMRSLTSMPGDCWSARFLRSGQVILFASGKAQAFRLYAVDIRTLEVSSISDGMYSTYGAAPKQ